MPSPTGTPVAGSGAVAAALPTAVPAAPDIGTGSVEAIDGSSAAACGLAVTSAVRPPWVQSTRSSAVAGPSTRALRDIRLSGGGAGHEQALFLELAGDGDDF